MLKEYLALSNVRLGASKRGGAREADVLGLKVRKEIEHDKGKEKEYDVLEILHIETGSLSGKDESNLKIIGKKFKEDRIKDIMKILSFILGTSKFDKIEYKPIYIAHYVSEKQSLEEKLSESKSCDIEFNARRYKIEYKIQLRTLDEVLKDIINDIDKWKKRQKERKLRKTKGITLPDSWWLLNLLDYMKHKGLLKPRLLKEINTMRTQKVSSL